VEETDLEVDVVVLEVVYRSAPIDGRTHQTVPQTLVLLLELIPHERREPSLGFVAIPVVRLIRHINGKLLHPLIHPRVHYTQGLVLTAYICVILVALQSVGLCLQVTVLSLKTSYLIINGLNVKLHICDTIVSDAHR